MRAMEELRRQQAQREKEKAGFNFDEFDDNNEYYITARVTKVWVEPRPLIDRYEDLD